MQERDIHEAGTTLHLLSCVPEAHTDVDNILGSRASGLIPCRKELEKLQCSSRRALRSNRVPSKGTVH